MNNKVREILERLGGGMFEAVFALHMEGPELDPQHCQKERNIA